jgi:cytidylate kinase
MNMPSGLERCFSFINGQLKHDCKILHGPETATRIRAVTISRQAGCGALAVAERLAEHLRAHAREEEPHWTVFDRNLVEKVLEDHHLPQRLAKFMRENWRSEIEDTLDELFGLHPPSWLMVRQTAETILRLVKLGNVIIIGRASNVITAKLGGVFHVRLVASVESRVRHIQESDHLDQKGAAEFVRSEDRGRGRYLKKYYHKDINDPLLYHLVINTDAVPYDEAAWMIAEVVERRAGGRE